MERRLALAAHENPDSGSPAPARQSEVPKAQQPPRQDVDEPTLQERHRRHYGFCRSADAHDRAVDPRVVTEGAIAQAQGHRRNGTGPDDLAAG